jgi:hypothetical protein
MRDDDRACLTQSAWRDAVRAPPARRSGLLDGGLTSAVSGAAELSRR